VVRIITIEREYGSGGAEIAKELAARLGWRLWDQLLMQEIARLAHCEPSAVEKREERRDSLYYRLLKILTFQAIAGSIASFFTPSSSMALSARATSNFSSRDVAIVLQRLSNLRPLQSAASSTRDYRCDRQPPESHFRDYSGPSVDFLLNASIGGHNLSCFTCWFAALVLHRKR